MKELVVGICLMAVLISCGKHNSTHQNNRVQNREHAFYASSQRCPLDSLLTQSKTQQKPVLLYFTAFSEVNCRKMEDQIFSSADIDQLMHKKFIPFALYTDDRKEITPAYISEFDGDSVTTLAKENRDLQIKLCKSNVQPHIVVIRWDKTVVGEMGYSYSTSDFKDFLEKALQNF